MPTVETASETTAVADRVLVATQQAVRPGKLPTVKLPHPRLRTVLLSAITVIVAVALVAGLLGVHAVRRPLPDYDGELALPGLTAPVTVHRDAYGIPQIYADTLDDLFMAQGFVHAQDRFWEMDFRRHVTAGRTAELFGADQVATDAFLRTLGWRQVAEAEWELLSQDTQRHLLSYAEGVNAWIEQTGGPAATGRKALQYRVLGLQNSGYEVAAWDPVDTLAWLKAMAWDLSGNLTAETDRSLMLAAGLTPEQVEQLYPDYPYDRREPIVIQGVVEDDAFHPAAADDTNADGTGEVSTDALAAAAGTLASVSATAAQVPPLLGINDAGLGSNSWVVHGSLTETGSPLLANDPHLGVSMPGIWYQMGLHCACDYRVSGFTFSGMPGVVIGHNDQIAWGFTNLAHDVTDLYLERVDGDQYQLDDEWFDLQKREETIRVAGGDEVTITVRQTHRGPLVSDEFAQLAELADSRQVADELGAPGAAGDDFAVSMAWTALTPGTTIEALFELNQAGNWDEFRAAAQLFEVPAQNLVYADVEGNIGYQAPGRVPVRGAGDGRWIAPGWDSAYDWVDYVPFSQLPHMLNPDEGYVVAANQAPVGEQYQPWLSQDWSYGYRSQRIRSLLDEKIDAGPIDLSDMEEMLVDNYNGLAPILVPALLAVPHAPLSRDERQALDLLRDWDFQQPAGGQAGTVQANSSAAAAYFNAVWRQLLELTFDELPDDVTPTGGDRWFDVVAGLLTEPESSWWDRVDTEGTQTRDDILVRALSDGYLELAAAQGDDPKQWRWGKLHTLTLRDESFGNSGIGPVEALFNRGPVETAGGNDVVNATGWDASQGYEVTASPSMRMVVDMADFDRSSWIQMTGNSGHAFHRHYTDQLELWRAGDTIAWRWDQPTIEAESEHTLRLLP